MTRRMLLALWLTAALVVLAVGGAVVWPDLRGQVGGALGLGGAGNLLVATGDAEVRRTGDGTCALKTNDGRGIRGRAPACLRVLFRRYGADAELVVLAHGLGRKVGSMESLSEGFAARGLIPVSLSYNGLSEPYAAHVDRLVAVLDAAGARRTHLVGHSLGGLVIRSALARRPDAPVGRIVMLGTPNQGSVMARGLTGPVEPSGALLSTLEALGRKGAAWDAWAPPAPSAPTLVIAGGRGDGAGYSPLIEGDDDGVVAVAEVRLEGAELHVVPALHSFMPGDVAVVRRAVAFVVDGELPPRAANKAPVSTGEHP